MMDGRNHDDTTADARRVLSDVYARMTPADKLRLMQQITMTANRLALAGLRARHPNDTDDDLLFRLTRMRLGDALVAAAYGEPRGRRGA